MRHAIVVLWILLGSVTSAIAQVSVGVGLPGVSIGINMPLYPELVAVPGYPVYYAPGVDSNFFFYDGMYWVYQSDNWYSSDWYNGPWGLVGPEYVPPFVLRVPVRYYRNPPIYFRSWRSDGPPRWGEHWGHDWERRHGGWDHWNRGSAPALAPLPVYQRQYSGDRYPGAEQQHALRNQNYRYQPREAVVRQHFQEHAAPRVPAPASQRPNASAQNPGHPAVQHPGAPDMQRPSPPAAAQRQAAPVEPRTRMSPRGDEDGHRSGPPPERPHPVAPAAQDPRPQPHQRAAAPEPQAPRPSPRNAPEGKDAVHESGRGQGHEKERERGRGDERGQGRN